MPWSIDGVTQISGGSDGLSFDLEKKAVSISTTIYRK